MGRLWGAIAACLQHENERDCDDVSNNNLPLCCRSCVGGGNLKTWTKPRAIESRGIDASTKCPNMRKLKVELSRRVDLLHLIPTVILLS